MTNRAPQAAEEELRFSPRTAAQGGLVALSNPIPHYLRPRLLPRLDAIPKRLGHDLFRTRMKEAYYYPNSAWITSFVGAPVGVAEPGTSWQQ